MDEDEGPHEDLNEHEMREEASDYDEGQQEFDESSDEVSADDNNSQGQQNELGTSTNFLFGATSRYGRAVLGEGGSHIKRGGMLVVSLAGVNFGFWPHLGCFGQNGIICSREGRPRPRPRVFATSSEYSHLTES